MLSKLLTYIQFKNQYYGIEHASKENTDHIFVTVLKKQKNSLDIDDTFEVSTIDDLEKRIPKKQAIHLVVNTDQVLFKNVKSNSENELEIIQEAFPAIVIDDFYYEIISSDNEYFISLSRKNYINQLIEKYKKTKIDVVSFSLKNNVVTSITDYINKHSFFTSNSKIILDSSNNTIIGFEDGTNNVKEPYDINGITVNNKHLLSLSSILSFIVKNNQPKSNTQTLQEALQNSYKQARFFDAGLYFSIGFLLITLLINALFFSHYYSKVEQLQATSEINLNLKNNFLKLKTKNASLEKVANVILKGQNSKNTLFISQITNSLPNSILFTEINYQPLLKRIKKDKAIEVEENNIIVSGKTTNTDDYSDWIERIENLNWVKKVETTDFSSAKKVADFSIKIWL